MVTSRMFDYAPPDTGVSNLQLVALERLPSIEGADKKQMAVTSLRGQFVGAEQSPAPTEDLHGFPCEGKLSPKGD